MFFFLYAFAPYKCVKFQTAISDQTAQFLVEWLYKYKPPNNRVICSHRYNLTIELGERNNSGRSGHGVHTGQELNV